MNRLKDYLKKNHRNFFLGINIGVVIGILIGLYFILKYFIVD